MGKHVIAAMAVLACVGLSNPSGAQPQGGATAVATAAAPAVATGGAKGFAITSLKKSPEAFKDLGDVVGISPEGAAAMGIKDGDFVELKSPQGKSVGLEVKTTPAEPGSLTVKKAVRDALGVQEGPVNLIISPLVWAGSDPKPAPVTFTSVGKPPKPFLKLGKAVGVSLERMRAMNASQGQKAIVTGPSGAKEQVGIYLLDRGADVISMGGVLRKKLAVEPGSAQIVLEPKPGKVQLPAAGTSDASSDD